MSYKSYSAHAPQGMTGVTTSIIHIVDNNPVSDDATDIKYPNQYDQFVNKTSYDSEIAIPITDENRKRNELTLVTGGTNQGYIYLHHRPINNANITISDASAVIQTGSTDYANGIVYFDTIPTGNDFIFTYVARPDAYFGDHINAI